MIIVIYSTPEAVSFSEDSTVPYHRRLNVFQWGRNLVLGEAFSSSAGYAAFPNTRPLLISSRLLLLGYSAETSKILPPPSHTHTHLCVQHCTCCPALVALAWARCVVLQWVRVCIFLSGEEEITMGKQWDPEMRTKFCPWNEDTSPWNEPAMLCNC